ncbi:LAO/AO transport system kinase [Propionibacterium cyclohexanicum]|uniref:LAO/AO transport system kinase n=1 Tax=Propionibacterium cyclohexanicum TaxID=64702 RepID=A0A1H9QCJ5_9ACTN|nr:methylmalonyl Co-A mutase-associated GTPase MeaB [Propionibacterium cyclohexanicum]SER58157.1 LAO/AO transport system kinase [Propionibacterium cyclohexanicum]
MPRRVDVPALAGQVMAGQRAGIAQAITLVESSLPAHRPLARELLSRLLPHSGNAVRVGLTGVPGAGKSTFIDAMGCRLIERGHKVAVLAVDPSSTRTGGSILGDRTRMGKLAESDDAYIRPSPSGGHLGGVARATREAMVIMEAAGYDTIIVETVGVGQSEVAVAGMVDTFLLLSLSGAGDQLQGIKRGILELADVIAVNKADGDNAAEARITARDLSIAMRLMNDESSGRRTPVLTCSALTHTGLDEVWQAVLDHRAWVESTIGLTRRRADQQVDWLWAQIEGTVVDSLRSTPELVSLGRRLESEVESSSVSALEASSEFLAAYAKAVPGFGWGD